MVGPVEVATVTPPAYAVWKRTESRGPSLAIARPGSAGSRPDASLVPMTSTLSSSSATRRAMRRLVLARICGVTTPAGRWVASTRWIPRERPRSATSTIPSMNSGTSFAKAANSSTTTIKDGGVAGWFWRSISTRSRAPALLRTISRYLSSASSDTNALRTPLVSRSVTSPTVWGSRAQSLKAAPPL